MIGAILFALVPCQLLCSYFIELAASRHAQRVIGRAKKQDKDRILNESKRTWFAIALLHSIISFFGLAATSYVIFYYVNHPGIGTVCEVQVIIVSLKSYSYALTNRDLRRAMLGSPSADSDIPELYRSCPYPRNITLGNLAYFLWAPTLVYQPVYPRTPRIRWSFVGKRLFEFVCLSVVMWLLSAQYAAPLLRNATQKIATLDIASILERGLKLSTISLVIWLAGFYALFQSLLNGLAEIMRFGDREFYTDWWNSPSFGVYWRSWNRPVYIFMKRHVYMPLVTRGWNPTMAGTVVFAVSAVLHEILVGVPTHNLIGMSFGHNPTALTDKVRCRVHSDDVPAPVDSSDCAFREAQIPSGKGYRKFVLLGNILRRWTASWSASVFLCMASEIRQRQSDTSVDC